MESPDSWDLLTSSLAVSNLSRPEQAWAFLVVQGIVASDSAALVEFLAVVRKVVEQGPITGPSDALRIAMGLRKAISISPSGSRPDPRGILAKARMETLLKWQ